MNREQRREWRRDIKRRKTQRRTPAVTSMLAREKWQIRTIQVLEEVFAHRIVQNGQYGPNFENPDGTGPSTRWLLPLSNADAESIEQLLRAEYEEYEEGAPITWLHLLREELAEVAKETDAARLEAELIQLGALCVKWVEALRERGSLPVGQDLL